MFENAVNVVRDHKFATTEILYGQCKQGQSQQELLLFSNIQSILLTTLKKKNKTHLFLF